MYKIILRISVDVKKNLEQNCKLSYVNCLSFCSKMSCRIMSRILRKCLYFVNTLILLLLYMHLVPLLLCNNFVKTKICTLYNKVLFNMKLSN